MNLKYMDLEQKAIERIRMSSEMSIQLYEQPLVVTASGGKGSTVCRELVKRAGIPYEVIHNYTTVDATETVYYVQETFRRLEEQKLKGDCLLQSEGKEACKFSEIEMDL